MDKKIARALKKFKSALEAEGIRVEKMVLFGSYAKREPREGSDIDVTIVFDSFRYMNLLKRLETIGIALAKAKIMETIEAIGYTTEEFALKNESTFVGGEVKAKGVEVM